MSEIMSSLDIFNSDTFTLPVGEGIETYNMNTSFKMGDVEIPYVIKNHTIFSPGSHNGNLYAASKIIQAFDNTNWDRGTLSLYLDHLDGSFEFNSDGTVKVDEQGTPVRIGGGVSTHVGYVNNIHLEGNGFVKGDVELYDPTTIIKLMSNAEYGISPSVSGKRDNITSAMEEFLFKNWSIVVDPACKTTYLNSDESLKTIIGDEIIDVKLAEWSAATVNDLPDSSFAYIESGGKKDSDGKTTPRSLRHLPYKDASGNVDAAHTRNALARLNQTKISSSAKATAKRKLVTAAKSVGIEVSENKMTEETTGTDATKSTETTKTETKDVLNDKVKEELAQAQSTIEKLKAEKETLQEKVSKVDEEKKKKAEEEAKKAKKDKEIAPSDAEKKLQEEISKLSEENQKLREITKETNSVAHGTVESTTANLSEVDPSGDYQLMNVFKGLRNEPQMDLNRI